MPKWSLHDVDFDEVSFVDSGAGPESHIVIAKRAADIVTPGTVLDVEASGDTGEITPKAIAKAVATDGVIYATSTDGSVYMLTDISVSKSDIGDTILTGEAVDLTGDPTDGDDAPHDESPSDDAHGTLTGDEGDSGTTGGEGDHDAADGDTTSLLSKIAKALGLAHLVKSTGDPTGTPTPIAKADFNGIVAARMAQEVVSEIQSLIYAFEDSVHDVSYDMSGEAKDALLKRNLADFASAVEHSIDEWSNRIPINKRNAVFAPSAQNDDLSSRYTSDDVRSVATGAVDILTGHVAQGDTHEPERSNVVAKFTREEIAKFAGIDTTSVTDDMIAKFNGHAADNDHDPNEPPEGISKSAWAKIDGATQEIIKAERARTDASNAVIAKMQEDSEIAVIAKRVGEFNLTGDSTEIAKTLHNISKAQGADVAKVVEDNMRAHANIAKSGSVLFEQFGSNGSGSVPAGIAKSGESTAYLELKKLADAHAAEHGVTFAKAMRNVSKSARGIELTAQHREELSY